MVCIGGYRLCNDCADADDLPFESFDPSETIQFTLLESFLRPLWSYALTATILAAMLTTGFVLINVLFAVGGANALGALWRLPAAVPMFFGFSFAFVSIVALPLGIGMASVGRPRRVTLAGRELAVERGWGTRKFALHDCQWRVGRGISDSSGFYLPNQRVVVVENDDFWVACGFDDDQREMWTRLFTLLGVPEKQRTDWYSVVSRLAIGVGMGGAVGIPLGAGLRLLTGVDASFVAAALLSILDGLILGLVSLGHTRLKYGDTKGNPWLIAPIFALLGLKVFRGTGPVALCAAGVNAVVGWVGAAMVRRRREDCSAPTD